MPEKTLTLSDVRRLMSTSQLSNMKQLEDDMLKATNCFRQICRKKKQQHPHFCHSWESQIVTIVCPRSARVGQQQILFVCLFVCVVGSSMYLRIAMFFTYVLLLRLVRCPLPFKAEFSDLLAHLWVLPLFRLDEHQLFLCRFSEPDLAWALGIVAADQQTGELVACWTSSFRREFFFFLLLLSRRLLQICPQILAKCVDFFLQHVAMSQPRTPTAATGVENCFRLLRHHKHKIRQSKCWQDKGKQHPSHPRPTRPTPPNLSKLHGHQRRPAASTKERQRNQSHPPNPTQPHPNTRRQDAYSIAGNQEEVDRSAPDPGLKARANPYRPNMLLHAIVLFASFCQFNSMVTFFSRCARCTIDSSKFCLYGINGATCGYCLCQSCCYRMYVFFDISRNL